LRVTKTRSDSDLIGETRGACVERSSFTMRSRRGCTHGCRRSVPQDSPRIGRCLGVMRETREVRRTRRGRRQQRQRLAVQCRAPVRQQRLFKRQPRQLVTEGEPVRLCHEHPRGQALLEPVKRFSGKRFE
jgi:hypothetical protein